MSCPNCGYYCTEAKLLEEDHGFTNFKVDARCPRDILVALVGVGEQAAKSNWFNVVSRLGELINLSLSHLSNDLQRSRRERGQ